ncbi:SIMPL domain-containing protein [Demequina salsinemoris]|uniref:SIMPL domain-containing protein n=1 Tax=Demequina salsinemoris TaxID=577470 RepID=UPI0007866105|nr:SIMPL domain-containing protein [Demequina salsinemoris]
MTDAQATVTVTGRGQACAAADSATVRLSCHAERHTVADAVADANAAVRLVRAAVSHLGVETDRSATAGVQIKAVEGRGRVGQETTVVGYSAVHRLAIEVADLQRLGETLAAAVAAAGDSARLDGVMLSLADPSELRARARDDAWADAVRAGTQLAERSARRLGTVLRIVEEPDGPLGRPALRAASMPVEPGGVEAQSLVTVTWELV